MFICFLSQRNEYFVYYSTVRFIRKNYNIQVTGLPWIWRFFWFVLLNYWFYFVWCKVCSGYLAENVSVTHLRNCCFYKHNLRIVIAVHIIKCRYLLFCGENVRKNNHINLRGLQYTWRGELRRGEEPHRHLPMSVKSTTVGCCL